MDTRERMLSERAEMLASVHCAARDALMIQDACNLQGIVRTLVEYLPAIAADARTGTQATNTHPVVQLFIGKLIELSGMGFADSEAYSKAYAACQALAEGPTVPCRAVPLSECR